MVNRLKLFSTATIIIFGYTIFFYGLNETNIKYKNKVFNKEKSTTASLDTDVEEILETKLKNNINKSETKKIKLLEKKENILKEIIYTVQKNQTFYYILSKFLSSDQLTFNIINEVQKIYDLRRLRENQDIIFYQDIKNEIKKITIPKDDFTDINIFISEKIVVEELLLSKKIENSSKEFKILNSLYLDGIKNEIPNDILVKLIRLFSFDLDFQRDIRVDTIVSVSYEEFYIEGRKEKKFGDIIYGKIAIEKNNLEYFRFKTDDGFVDYFNRDGKNVKKSILKTPIDGARLSSTFGMRKHPILGYNKMHRGIDFAAPIGTPVYAGGNGVIEYLGNNGSYGKYIRIRHLNGYKTAYAHLSAYKKGLSKGSRVNQGETIAYVGSTGRSTGPHLHYEIIYNNNQINPLKLKLPSGKVLKGKELERFKKSYKTIYANHLNLLYE